MPDTITARDANHHFARLLRDVEAGKEFIVTRNGVPVARILPAGAGDAGRRCRHGCRDHRCGSRFQPKDHATAPALLRDCVGRDLPDGRLNDLKGLLSIKDEVRYGARLSRHDAASRAINQLGRFANRVIAWPGEKGIR
jgi:prevent-host-death family protein